MATELIIRYLHFLSIFVMFSCLCAEHVVLKHQLDLPTLKRLRIMDAAYGIAALTALVCGLTLWLWVGKPASFYSVNWVFHAKIGLFIVVGLLSLVPTLFLMKATIEPDCSIDVPKYVVQVIRIELLILCIIPLFAVIMARGLGYTDI